MTMPEQQDFLSRLAKGVANLFGANCEVAIHDLTKGYEGTIIAIENGHVTGRHIGDDASELVLQAIKDKENPVEDHYCYLARTKEGRMIKSSSIYVRDKNNKPIGLFGLNYDITDLIMAQNALATAISADKPADEKKIGTISTNVTDLLDQLIVESDEHVGKPVAMMTKDDKTRAIQFLSDRGAFLIKKSGDKVTKHYDISKYTLYNYMDAEN